MKTRDFSHRNGQRTGYREYHEQNIEALKKIKLLRKLGISVEEIRAVLNHSRSLEDCLEKHLTVLEKERENRLNMQRLSDAILQQRDSIDTLNTNEWLDEMEKLEKEGVDFVNVSKIDIRMKKKMGAVIGGAVMIVLMLAMIGFFLWANSQETLPVGILIVFLGIPVIVIICIIVALRSRIREIEGGEEDEAAKY